MYVFQEPQWCPFSLCACTVGGRRKISRFCSDL